MATPSRFHTRPSARAAALVVIVFTAAAQERANTSQPQPAVDQKPRNVAIVVHDGVELLDFAGPAEVFSSAGRRAFNVYLVGPEAGPVDTQQNVKVVATYSFKDCPKPDIVVIPGGNTGVLLRDAAMMKWIGETAQSCEVALTVCTGAFALAQAGLLDGLEATTHWSAIDSLRRQAPKATVKENVRFVDNGRIITAAGISAGIDGSLHLVARLCGEQAARDTARYMEYRWER